MIKWVGWVGFPECQCNCIIGTGTPTLLQLGSKIGPWTEFGQSLGSEKKVDFIRLEILYGLWGIVNWPGTALIIGVFRMMSILFC